MPSSWMDPTLFKQWWCVHANDSLRGSLTLTIHQEESVAFSNGLVTDKHRELITCCVEWTCKAIALCYSAAGKQLSCKFSPIPYICKLKLLSESYVCADLPLQLEIALKPPLTAERAWLVWLKSFHSKGQEWSVAPLALDVILCSRSTWQGLANSPLAG